MNRMFPLSRQVVVTTGGAGILGSCMARYFASESALIPLTRVADYGVTKAAVVNFTKYMCAELAVKFGDTIRVNAIVPSFFLTEQNRALLANPDGPPYSIFGLSRILFTAADFAYLIK